MKDLPNSFYAAVFIGLACVLAVVALYAPGGSDKAAVITMASSIITGAFGYIQGHKDGAANPSQNNPK
jgi:hypothetical protein